MIKIFNFTKNKNHLRLYLIFYSLILQNEGVNVKNNNNNQNNLQNQNPRLKANKLIPQTKSPIKNNTKVKVLQQLDTTTSSLSLQKVIGILKENPKEVVFVGGALVVGGGFAINQTIKKEKKEKEPSKLPTPNSPTSGEKSGGKDGSIFFEAPKKINFKDVKIDNKFTNKLAKESEVLTGLYKKKLELTMQKEQAHSKGYDSMDKIKNIMSDQILKIVESNLDEKQKALTLEEQYKTNIEKAKKHQKYIEDVSVPLQAIEDLQSIEKLIIQEQYIITNIDKDYYYDTIIKNTFFDNQDAKQVEEILMVLEQHKNELKFNEYYKVLNDTLTFIPGLNYLLFQLMEDFSKEVKGSDSEKIIKFNYFLKCAINPLILYKGKDLCPEYSACLSYLDSFTKSSTYKKITKESKEELEENIKIYKKNNLKTDKEVIEQEILEQKQNSKNIESHNKVQEFLKYNNKYQEKDDSWIDSSYLKYEESIKNINDSIKNSADKYKKINEQILKEKPGLMSKCFEYMLSIIEISNEVEKYKKLINIRENSSILEKQDKILKIIFSDYCKNEQEIKKLEEQKEKLEEQKEKLKGKEEQIDKISKEIEGKDDKIRQEEEKQKQHIKIFSKLLENTAYKRKIEGRKEEIKEYTSEGIKDIKDMKKISILCKYLSQITKETTSFIKTEDTDEVDVNAEMLTLYKNYNINNKENKEIINNFNLNNAIKKNKISKSKLKNLELFCQCIKELRQSRINELTIVAPVNQYMTEITKILRGDESDIIEDKEDLYQKIKNDDYTIEKLVNLIKSLDFIKAIKIYLKDLIKQKIQEKKKEQEKDEKKKNSSNISSQEKEEIEEKNFNAIIEDTEMLRTKVFETIKSSYYYNQDEDPEFKRIINSIVEELLKNLHNIEDIEKKNIFNILNNKAFLIESNFFEKLIKIEKSQSTFSEVLEIRRLKTQEAKTTDSTTKNKIEEEIKKVKIKLVNKIFKILLENQQKGFLPKIENYPHILIEDITKKDNIMLYIEEIKQNKEKIIFFQILTAELENYIAKINEIIDNIANDKYSNEEVIRGINNFISQEKTKYISEKELLLNENYKKQQMKDNIVLNK